MTLFHMQEFANALTNFNIEPKLVVDSDVYDGFPSTNIVSWFQSRLKFNKLVCEFRPDAILVDRQRHFCLAAAQTKLPSFMLLRGDFWKEAEAAKEKYKSLPAHIAISRWQKIAEQCFSQTNVILPVCKYLENIVKARYPDKPTPVLYTGINPSRWYAAEPMNLKHPCVGLLQTAVIWDKTKEMLTLTKALESMPEVMFYWAGDGYFRHRVLEVLGKYDNFKWLGMLQYPDKVREYLSTIDVYALASGLDMSPLSLQQAQLMERPVVATNVGGIPELMVNEKTGLLVEKGDYKGWIEKLSLLINDEKKGKQMGAAAREFVKYNFSWDRIAKRFVEILGTYLGKSERNRT